MALESSEFVQFEKTPKSTSERIGQLESLCACRANAPLCDYCSSAQANAGCSHAEGASLPRRELALEGSTRRPGKAADKNLVAPGRRLEILVSAGICFRAAALSRAAAALSRSST